MADINANKHGLVTDLGPKRHSPQITAKLGIHLSNNVQEDTVIVLRNGAISDELRNDW
jgi:hypothetical protein